jgi:hypothetical protein
MSIDYLSMMSSSVPSERIFSRSGFINNKYRNKLSPNKIKEILIMNSFLELDEGMNENQLEEKFEDNEENNIFLDSDEEDDENYEIEYINEDFNNNNEDVDFDDDDINDDKYENKSFKFNNNNYIDENDEDDKNNENDDDENNDNDDNDKNNDNDDNDKNNNNDDDENEVREDNEKNNYKKKKNSLKNYKETPINSPNVTKKNIIYKELNYNIEDEFEKEYVFEKKIKDKNENSLNKVSKKLFSQKETFDNDSDESDDFEQNKKNNKFDKDNLDVKFVDYDKNTPKKQKRIIKKPKIYTPSDYSKKIFNYHNF